MTEIAAIRSENAGVPAESLSTISPRPDPRRFQQEIYPLQFDSRIRFSDLDVLVHVNNLALEAFHEDARATLNQRAFGGAGPLDGPRFMAAQNTTHFLAQAFWPGELTVAAGVGRIGRTSYVAASALFDGLRCVSVCDTVLVLVGESGPVEIEPTVSMQLLPYLLSTGRPGTARK